MYNIITKTVSSFSLKNTLSKYSFFLQKIQCPIAIELSVTEIQLKELMEAENKKLHSESVNAFNIPGVQYYISISLNDEEQDRRGEAWIFFYLHFSDEIKIESDFTITIESANYHTNCNYVFEKSIGWGEMIGTTKELFDPQNRYIVDGKLTFKVEGTLMVEKGLPKKAETFGDHCNALCLNLWNQEENKDFTIVAGGKEIAVSFVTNILPIHNYMYLYIISGTFFLIHIIFRFTNV